MRRSLLLQLSVAGIFMACDAGSGPPIRTRRSSPLPAAQWRIAEEAPDFLASGGAFRGDSIFFFRVIDGALLGDGGAVITTSPEAKVIFLDSAGAIRNVVGGYGEGPQEFRSTPFIVSDGEKLVLLESGRLKDLTGSGLGPARPSHTDRRHSMAGVFEDGVIVTAPGGLVVGHGESEYTVGFSVTPYVLWRGDVADTILGPPSPPLPAFPFYKPDGNLSVFVPGKAGCLPQNHYSVSGTQLVIADASAGLVLAVDRAGALDTIFQSKRRATVTKEMVDGASAYLRRADAGSSRQAFLARVGQVGDPLPAIWSDALWSEGTAWLRHAAPCFTGADARPQLWDVVDLESRSLTAVVEVPPTLYVLAVGADRILAMVTDDLGVQNVGVYRIRSREAP